MIPIAATYLPIRSVLLLLTLSVVLSLSDGIRWSSAQDAPLNQPANRLDDAIDRGFKILYKGVQNYPEHRSCFSCHHQALPLLAMSQHQSNSTPYWKTPIAQSILEFTEESFVGKRELMRMGQGVGGKALTAGYGLWTMDLARAPRNDTIDAMLEYLLVTQSQDGAWDFQSLRPPAASSRSMATAIAVYSLRAFGVGSIEKNRLDKAFNNARKWADIADPTQSHEELIGFVWLDTMLNQEGVKSDVKREFPRTKIGQRQTALSVSELLSESQRDDGGWAQMPDMESDAYATGQALLMLNQIGMGTTKSIHDDEFYRNGIDFLLRTQHADGSWHVVSRSKPVQVYFDNGDPHGKDQFISMMATSWATAALANHRSRGVDPLESFQVAERRLHR